MASASVKLFQASTLLILLLLNTNVHLILATKTCDKIDVCSCKMSDGSGTISLWELDGKDGPAFTKIPDQDHDSYQFSYNPCKKISTTKECKDANVCQNTGGSDYYPCGSSDTTFSVNSIGGVEIHYGKMVTGIYTRLSTITLVCAAKIKTGDFGPGFSERQTPPSKSEYTGTLKTRCACPNTCKVPSNPSGSSGGLSTGSILLIIFFPLVLLYFVLGIVVNIFVRNKEGMPDIIPNNTLWCDFPYLVKDGFVFSFGKIKECCLCLTAKCKGESEYTPI